MKSLFWLCQKILGKTMMKVKIIFHDGKGVSTFKNILKVSSLGESWIMITPKYSISKTDFILSNAVHVGNSEYDFAIPKDKISDFIITQ